MEEKFKSLKINGLFYEIGSNGTVIGCSGKVLSQREDKDGYMRVTVGTQENRTVIRVHRLVAICHVDNPNPKDFNEVNHLDYNRKNNNYKNIFLIFVIVFVILRYMKIGLGERKCVSILVQI